MSFSVRYAEKLSASERNILLEDSVGQNATKRAEKEIVLKTKNECACSNLSRSSAKLLNATSADGILR